MDGNDKFALVPKSPSAVEQIEPGATRVLSSMVADTLALAQREADKVESLFQIGLQFQRVGKLTEAFGAYRQAAEMGHLFAQYQLGKCYLRGDGVNQSEIQGIAWLEKALERGSGLAGFVLGTHFDLGLLPKYSEAIKYYKRAAELGYTYAAENMAVILKRLQQAGETPAIKEAAEHGNADASFEMGMRCLQGIGVLQSATEAFRWFRMAAEEYDHPDAWAFMGSMFQAGIGTPPDKVKAIECYQQASDLGHNGAYSLLRDLSPPDKM